MDDPIGLPNGRESVTLQDRGIYITKLPKVEHEAREWQAAAEVLLMVAERSGIVILAALANGKLKASPMLRSGF